MKTLNKAGIAFAGMFFVMAYLAMADEMDVAESKDHPLFTRMPDYYIDVKPESEPVLKEVAKLLSESPSLKLYVVGHTDNVGEIDYNMKLSQARAEAVVKELTTKYSISGDRIKPFGVGPLAPVVSNKTDEGRAKNRRVELIEQ